MILSKALFTCGLYMPSICHSRVGLDSNILGCPALRYLKKIRVGCENISNGRSVEMIWLNSYRKKV
jgi:hypothetical protein